MASSLYSALELSLLRSGEEDLLISDSLRLNGRELLEKVEALSVELAKTGCKPGSLIALKSASNIDFIVALLACIKSEAIAAPLSVELSSSAYREAIQRLNPQFEWVLGEEKSIRESEHFKDSPELAELCPQGGFIRFTSGTTSESKGVVISANKALERAEATSKCFALSRGQAVCSLMDLPYHFIASVLSFLLDEVKLIISSSKSWPSIMDQLREEKVTFLYGAPFHYQCLLQSGRNLPDLIRAVSTSAVLHPEVVEQFETVIGCQLYQSLGIIEVGLAAYGPARGSSLGQVAPGYEVKLFEEESGQGLLGIRGPGGFDAYLSPFQLAEKVLREGWFVSGDIVEINEGISLVGRAGSAINVAGHKIYPEPVEEFILNFSEVSDCRVGSESHSISGQCLVAEVVYRGEKSFEQFSKEFRKECRKKLGRLSTPVKVYPVSSISKTKTGKTLRAEPRVRR